MSNINVRKVPISGALYPQTGFPIDARGVFDSLTVAQNAAKKAGEIGNTNSEYYFGMKVFVDDAERGIFAWYTIQRDGTLLADDKDGSSLVGMKLIGQDSNGGNIYEQTYSDGTKVQFVAPKGRQGDKGDPGEKGVTVDGKFFTFETDAEGNLFLVHNSDTPPDVTYDPDTGDLYLTIDGTSKYIGKVKGEKGDSLKVKSIDFVNYDSNGGAIYNMTFENDESFQFVAPKGKDGEGGATPYVGENGNWWIDGEDTGERASALSINGHYFIETDDENNLIVSYQDGSTPPNFEYDPESGSIYIIIDDFIRREIGKIKGVDLHLEKGSGKYSLQQSGSLATGDYSFARGAQYVLTESTGGESVSNEASGVGATAEGAGTLATGDGSHAEGSIGKPNVDTNEYRPTTAKRRGSHAEGCGSIADGNGAHSEGYATEAKAEGAHSEGKRTIASAEGAHSEGKGHWDSNKKVLTYTEASGEASHAEGLGTKAIGKASHAEGLKGQAKGNHSHVEGSDGAAHGNNSHVEGWSCKTYGGASHAGGEASIARGYASFAQGVWVEATGLGQSVVGLPNEDNSEAVFIVGNGEVDSDYEPKSRSNAFEVMKDGTARVGGKQVATLDDIGTNNSNIASELAKKISFEVAEDGTVYLITED